MPELLRAPQIRVCGADCAVLFCKSHPGQTFTATHLTAAMIVPTGCVKYEGNCGIVQELHSLGIETNAMGSTIVNAQHEIMVALYYL